MALVSCALLFLLGSSARTHAESISARTFTSSGSKSYNRFRFWRKKSELLSGSGRRLPTEDENTRCHATLPPWPEASAGLSARGDGEWNQRLQQQRHWKQQQSQRHTRRAAFPGKLSVPVPIKATEYTESVAAADLASSSSSDAMPVSVLGGGAPLGQTELKIRLYLDETDAFGLIFHANYLKYIERLIQAECTDILSGSSLSSAIPVILSAEELKFQCMVKLGDLVTVKRKVVGFSDRAVSEQIQIVNEDGKSVVTAKIEWGLISPGTNGATIPLPPAITSRALGAGAEGQQLSFYNHDPRESIERLPEGGIVIPHTVLVEDVDGTGFLSNYAVLRYFEKIRCDQIGGPREGVQRFCDEGYSAVTYKLDKLTFGSDATGRPKLGDRLESRVVPLLNESKKLNLRFLHELWKIGPNGEEELAATGFSNILFLKKGSTRPTKIPKWGWEMLEHTATHRSRVSPTSAYDQTFWHI